MKNAWIFGVAVATLVAVPAMAADKNVYKAPLPVWNWSGCYVGGDIGGGKWSQTGTTTGFPSPGFGAPATTGGLPGFGVLPTTHDLGSVSVVGGFHAGCNYQAARNWLVGVEGDYMFVNHNSSNTQAVFGTFLGAPAGGVFTMQLNNGSRYLASARGRVGWVVDQWMIFATGGAAWTDNSGNAFVTNAPGVGAPGLFGIATPFTDSKTGWVVGGGVEVLAYANWLIRLEYLHYEFAGSSSVLPFVVGNLPLFGPCGPGLCNWAINTSRERFDTVRFGVSYKFGGDVIMAKY